MTALLRLTMVIALSMLITKMASTARVHTFMHDDEVTDEVLMKRLREPA